MMTKKEAGAQCMRYIRQELYLAVGLFLATLLVMQVRYMDYLLMPAVVSVVFSLVVAVATGLVWRRVATSTADTQTTFFTAVGGFRLLLALATLFGCYLVAGRESMVRFFVVFAVFYFVLLAHHSVFFARLNNKPRRENR